MTIHPNNDEVICPACAHQFRAIPVNVQAMLLTAGHTPPFMNEQKIAPVLSDDRAEFEAWCKPRGYRVMRSYADVDRYQHPETDVAWETWQAVLAALDADAKRYRAVRAGIDDGAEWIRIVGTLKGSGTLSFTGESADIAIDRVIARAKINEANHGS